jgi:hypothetical protein
MSPLQVALFLIGERAAGSASPWAAYIGTLPEQPPSPLLWGAAERDLLASTQLLQSLLSYECAFCIARMRFQASGACACCHGVVVVMVMEATILHYKSVVDPSIPWRTSR